MIDKNELKERISDRKQKLDEIKIKLKEKFFGIDEVIDDVIEKISLWYLMPEVQINPLIISLWGITGVGKTDLVRTLVDLLDFNNKFVEIQMDSKKTWKYNIEDYIEDINIGSDEPMILLLDEIQRYRTIDEKGMLIKNECYNDIWNLLSDGQFSAKHTRINELISKICDVYYSNDIRNNNNNVESDDDIKAPKTEKKYKRYYYDALSIKKLLKLKDSINKIMEMSNEELIIILEAELQNNKINNGIKYNQMLIFISGNIDEAYKFADNVDDADKDADVYYEQSKKINILDIKKALTDKFKPEQISRFGNNHIIYPTISKEGYNRIIHSKINELIEKIRKSEGINIELSDKYIDVIYRNGVFPAQGVRPLISTVNQICGEVFSYFLFKSICSDVTDIKIDVESDETAICEINGSVEKKKINLQIDRIRNSRTNEDIAIIAVHEIGHALVYSILTKLKPDKIEIRGSKSDGFVSSKRRDLRSKCNINDTIIVCLGGLSAEEIVFGADNRTDGSARDIDIATYESAMMIRKYGMNKFISSIDKVNLGEPSPGRNYDLEQTNPCIEEQLVKAKNMANQIILNNIDLYKELVRFAVQNKSISIEAYSNIFQKYGIELFDNVPEFYHNKLKEFLSDDVTN